MEDGIGFAVGLLLGLAVYYLAGSDADWVRLLTKYVTTPFSQIFLNLIFMLIVPLLFRRWSWASLKWATSARWDGGWRTLGYTVVLSGVAVLLGLVLVNVLKPGAGVDPQVANQLIQENAERTREIISSSGTQPQGMGMLLSIVPSNVIAAASSNGAILSLMFLR